MLTVKLVCIDGSDEVFQAEYVRRGKTFEPGGKPSWDQVTFARHDAECHAPVNSGCVYVMNDAGKTVSVYTLGWEEKGIPPSTNLVLGEKKKKNYS